VLRLSLAGLTHLACTDHHQLKSAPFMQAVHAVAPCDVQHDNQAPVQQAARVAEPAAPVVTEEPAHFAERRRHIVAAYSRVMKRRMDAMPAAERKDWTADITQEWHNEDQGAGLVKDQARLIGATMERAGASGTAADALRTGRPRKLPETLVKRALHLFYKGNDQPGDKWLGFRSMSHFLIDTHEIWQELHNYKASVPTLWRRMQEAARKSGQPMHKITISYRAGVPKSVFKERLDATHRWLKLTDRQRACMTWIDEKRVYVTERGKYRCWAPPWKKDNIQRPANELLSHDKRLNYICADSELLGAIYIAPLTGTSGSLGTKGYLVRTRVPARRHLDPASCVPHSPRCLDDTETHVGILPADAQDAVARPRRSHADGAVCRVLIPRALALILPAEVVLAVPVER
jgi:hypothetical protein